MLTKTQLKILAYLIDNKGEPLGIRELAKRISTVYYLVQRNIQQLKKKKIILLQKAGKTSLISLHQLVDSAYLIETENFKRELFYQKYPHLKVTFKKIITSAKSCFFVVLVFGSYVKKPRNDSDLDLLMIVPNQKQAKLIEKIVSSIARTSTIKIHETIVIEKSFVSMLQKKELNVANEAKEKHILIYGDGLYYKLLRWWTKKKFKKRVKEADSIITSLINEEKITKLSEPEKIKFIDFYKKQANLSLIAADLLYNISTEKASKEFHKLNPDYECFLWAINASYYTMFYAVHALLAYKGVRILSKQGTHKITAHALVYYCVKNDFIAKELYEQFVQSQQEAAELLNLEDFKEKAKDLTTKYFYEAEKRSKFTYETEEEAKQRHANTSLQRAREFLNEIEKIIGGWLPDITIV